MTRHLVFSSFLSQLLLISFRLWIWWRIQCRGLFWESFPFCASLSASALALAKNILSWWFKTVFNSSASKIQMAMTLFCLSNVVYSPVEKLPPAQYLINGEFIYSFFRSSFLPFLPERIFINLLATRSSTSVDSNDIFFNYKDVLRRCHLLTLGISSLVPQNSLQLLHPTHNLSSKKSQSFGGVLQFKTT